MKRQLGALALTLGVGASFIGAPASAATSTDLYVNNQTGANCSNGGEGTQSQPYCTIGAAAVVNPGQTVHVSGSSYPEHLTIDRSGIPDQPIIFAAVSTAPVMLTGTDPGISIDGQHDVSVYGFGVGGRQTGPAVSIRNSTRLKLDHTTSRTPRRERPRP